MYNIALVNHVDRAGKSQYINELEKNKCSVQPVTVEELKAKVSGFNAVIIAEPSLEEIGHTCEMIMKVRSLTNSFVWVLSSQSTKVNRIIYLQLGADGTFDERIDLDEFRLHILNNLERSQSGSTRRAHVSSKKKGIHLVPENFSVVVEDGEEVSLTKLEFIALQYLYEQQGQAVSYEELYERIWGSGEGDRKYRISNLIFHLRKKLSQDSKGNEYIKTVRSKGYMLVR